MANARTIIFWIALGPLLMAFWLLAAIFYGCMGLVTFGVVVLRRDFTTRMKIISPFIWPLTWALLIFAMGDE